MTDAESRNEEIKQLYTDHVNPSLMRLAAFMSGSSSMTTSTFSSLPLKSSGSSSVAFMTSASNALFSIYQSVMRPPALADKFDYFSVNKF